MNRRTMILGGTALVGLGACTSKFRSYDGPQVTSIVVNKGSRNMYLLHHDQVLEEYPIRLGFAPVGHKEVEGDGKTPEGRYYIDRRNPNSQFHLSLGISYPNDEDRARAKELGKPPGGDIFIHGQKSFFAMGRGDWTWGCIAVSNRQMEQIYAMVGTGTPIQINA